MVAWVKRSGKDEWEVAKWIPLAERNDPQDHWMPIGSDQAFGATQVCSRPLLPPDDPKITTRRDNLLSMIDRLRGAVFLGEVDDSDGRGPASTVFDFIEEELMRLWAIEDELGRDAS